MNATEPMGRPTNQPLKDSDMEKGDEVLHRLLKTPPDPGHKARASERDQKKKPDDDPAKKRRPEKK
jgi:hypothetical protein